MWGQPPPAVRRAKRGQETLNGPKEKRDVASNVSLRNF